jgi:hypothetical protein
VFYCDGVSVGTNTSAPYQSSWNSKAAANGSHKLYAQAFDASNNSLMSSSNTVTVNNVTNATPGALQWVRNGVCVAGSLVTPTGIVTDRSNNVVVAGLFQASVDFGGNTGQLVSAGGNDCFIVKYNAQGVAQWSKRIGGASDDCLHGVTVDSGGNIIVVGYFTGAVDFGGVMLTSATNPLMGTAVLDTFVAKYSPSGTLMWAQKYGGTGGGDIGNAVAVDGSDNIYVALQWTAVNVAFGGYTLSSGGGSDMVLAKLSPQGAVMWAEDWGGAGNDYVYGLAVDQAGNLSVTGAWGGGNLGGGSVGSGIFVAKYSGANGGYQWSKIISSGGSGDMGNGVAIDPGSGNVIVAGTLGGAANFGGGVTPSGGVFLAAYDAGGNYLWSKTFNTSVIPASSTDSGNGVSVDAGGNIALTGYAQNSNFGGGWIGGGYFLANFTSAGAYRWAANASGTGNRTGYSVAFDTSGHVVVAGAYNGSVSIGGTPLTTPSLYQAPFTAQYTK